MMTSIEHQGPLPAAAADIANGHGLAWLTNAAALLRAAKVLTRAHLADLASISNGAPGMFRQPLSRQVAFLAALALENALKAVIADCR